MCQHDTFRHYNAEETVQRHDDGSRTVKVLMLRVCVHCLGIDRLTDEGWESLKEVPCQSPTLPPA